VLLTEIRGIYFNYVMGVDGFTKFVSKNSSNGILNKVVYGMSRG
jgi:hypothetical protein